jgi:hypothetical protein
MPLKTYCCRGCHTRLWGHTCYECGGSGVITGIANREVECDSCRGYGTKETVGYPTMHRVDGQVCKWHHYGDWVCSERCDIEVHMRMLGSMPGAGPCRELDPNLLKQISRRWNGI